MVGGTPRIPLLEGGFGAGVVVVTFTDIVSCWGGSSGRDPCRLTTGSSVAASASSSGPGAAIVLSRFSSTAGPQVSEWCHGRLGALISILSYLRARDPERILPYVDRGTFVF